MTEPHLILKALYQILRYPPVDDIQDPERKAAAQALVAMNLAVFVNSRPMDSPDVCATIETTGGENHLALGGYGWMQSDIDVIVWGKTRTNRSLAEKVQKATEYIQTLLTQYRGESAGVTIKDIAGQGGALQMDEPPRDESDDWHTGLSVGYSIIHSVIRPGTVTPI